MKLSTFFSRIRLAIAGVKVQAPKKAKVKRYELFAISAAKAIGQTCVTSQIVKKPSLLGGSRADTVVEPVYDEAKAWHIIEGAIRFGRPSLWERILLLVAGQGKDMASFQTHKIDLGPRE